MTRLLPLAVATMLAAGCATTAPRPQAPDKGSCSAGELADYIGRPASARLGEELMQASGAKLLQWIRLGQAVTMDFQLNRLRVQLGADNKVMSASCG